MWIVGPQPCLLSGVLYMQNLAWDAAILQSGTPTSPVIWWADPDRAVHMTGHPRQLTWIKAMPVVVVPHHQAM